jgi:hypothetical protein
MESNEKKNTREREQRPKLFTTLTKSARLLKLKIAVEKNHRPESRTRKAKDLLL